MVKKNIIEQDISIDDDSDSDSLMEKPKPCQKKVLGSIGSVKEKKPFVMTEARKKALKTQEQYEWKWRTREGL